MSELEDVLRQHVGEENAISSTELANKLGLRDSNGNPKVRFGIRRLIESSGLPIGACESGYYVIKSERELIEYLNRLDKRKEGIEERKEMVEQAFQSKSQQAKLPSK